MADLLAAADKLGWRLTDEADLQSIGGRLDHNSLLKAFGDLDIRDFGAPILDKLTKSQKIEGPLVLQIKNIRNVSAPKINESSGAHPKLLKITLTDGHATVNALDLSRNPVISLDTPPGTKVLIKGIVPVEQRFWILSDRSVDCLGGKVEHLVEKWEISKISDVHFSRIRKTGADGPPPWIPFGQRLKTAVQTVDGNFKALGVQSSNPSDADGPDEFALARQQTISELKSQSGQVAAKKFESVKVPLTNGTAALSEAQPRERKTKATGKQESSKYCRDVRMAFDNDYDDPNEAQKPAAPTTLMDFLDSKVLKDQPKANVKPSYEPSQEQPRYDQRGYDNRQNSRDNNSRDSSSTYRGRGRGQSGADSGRGRGRGGRGQNSDRPQRAYDHGREDMDRRNQPIQRPFQTYEADFPQVSKPPPSTQPSRQSNDARLAGADMVKHFGAMKISNEIAAQPTRKEYPRSQWQRGDVCLAQYFGDGRFYDATIVAVDDRTQMCDVLFENFSNVEQVAIRNLLPHPRYTMTLLENEHFLAELGKLFQKAKTSSSISITMKRYDGRTKPKPRDVEELPVPHEYKCLFRASVGSKKISTVVNPKEVNKFQLAYASLLKLHMDSLKKREKKADKDKEKKTVRSN